MVEMVQNSSWLDNIIYDNNNNNNNLFVDSWHTYNYYKKKSYIHYKFVDHTFVSL